MSFKKSASVSSKKRPVLGRGLESLFSSEMERASKRSPSVKHPLLLGIEQLQVNSQQPRKVFDKESLKSLTQSIRENGLIQPIVVKRSEEQPARYEIVAGERRWRAASAAGLHEVPVWILRDRIVDKSILALVENLQREDLNPMELALAYQQVLKKKQWTQEQLAETLAISRTSLTNYLRLLQLPPEVQKMILNKKLSFAVSKVLLKEKDPKKQLKWAKVFVTKEVDVRTADNLISSLKHLKKPSMKLTSWQKQSLKKIEDIYEIIGSLHLKKGKGEKAKGGELRLRFYSVRQLHQLMEALLCQTLKNNKS